MNDYKEIGKYYRHTHNTYYKLYIIIIIDGVIKLYLHSGINHTTRIDK